MLSVLLFCLNNTYNCIVSTLDVGVFKTKRNEK